MYLVAADARGFRHIKIGITYPRPLWRPQPSTLLCQGPPNRLHRWGFVVFFFRNANLPFKSDRIMNLLIAVAGTEEEKEEEDQNLENFK